MCTNVEFLKENSALVPCESHVYLNRAYFNLIFYKRSSSIKMKYHILDTKKYNLKKSLLT